MNSMTRLRETAQEVRRRTPGNEGGVGQWMEQWQVRCGSTDEGSVGKKKRGTHLERGHVVRVIFPGAGED